MAQNSRRVSAALANSAEALAFAGEQAEAGQWRWVAIASCIALQGALVAALSGYETAQAVDVLHPEEAGQGGGSAPGQAPKIATIQTLLRRVGSADYLTDPERLSGHRAAVRAALDLVALRNRAVHVSPDGERADFAAARAGVAGACEIIHHLVIAHPAFDPAANGAVRSEIDRALKRLSAAIC